MNNPSVKEIAIRFPAAFSCPTDYPFIKEFLFDFQLPLSTDYPSVKEGLFSGSYILMVNIEYVGHMYGRGAYPSVASHLIT